MNKEILVTLGYNYMEGDEENDIFINRQKAKELFDEADWEQDVCEDTETEWAMNHVDYILQGSPQTLDGIEAMSDDLSQRVVYIKNGRKLVIKKSWESYKEEGMSNWASPLFYRAIKL